MELELVEQLRGVAADEVEKPDGRLGRVLGRLREVEHLREPARLAGDVLEQRRPSFRDGLVPEPFLLQLQLRRGVREVLRVPGLVEEGLPVEWSAHRLHHEHHALGHLDRDAERTRILRRPRIDVQMDVLLGPEVDAERLERPLERRHHPVRWEVRVPGLTAEQP